MQSVTITIKGTLWLLLFKMTVISERHHLQLLSVAQKRIQPYARDVSQNQLTSLVSSSLSCTHTHMHTAAKRRFASFNLLESGFSDSVCQIPDKKKERKQKACSADTSCYNDQEMTINSRPDRTIYHPEHS